jgi:hypothetical protein
MMSLILPVSVTAVTVEADLPMKRQAQKRQAEPPASPEIHGNTRTAWLGGSILPRKELEIHSNERGWI